MAIISALPYTLTNGTTADATQVEGNFDQIVAQVNANAAALAGATFTGAVALPSSGLLVGTTQFAIAGGSATVGGNLVVSGVETLVIGTGSGRFRPRGVANAQLTPTGNAATTVATVLQTWDLPANSLITVAQKVVVEGWGTVVSDGVAKAVVVGFGSTSLSVINNITAAGVPGWYYKLEVVRTGSNSQIATLFGGLGQTYATQVARLSENEATAITIRTLGTPSAGNANEIVAEAQITEFAS